MKLVRPICLSSAFAEFAIAYASFYSPYTGLDNNARFICFVITLSAAFSTAAFAWEVTNGKGN